MSLTVTEIIKDKLEGAFYHVFKVGFDNSYTTGGVALTAATLGLIADEFFRAYAHHSAGISVEYDTTNQKLKAYAASVPGGGGEYAYVPGGGDVKGCTLITAAMNTADQAADIVNAGLNVAYQSVTTINGAVGSFGTITNQPALGRTVNVSVKNASGGSLNLFTGTTAFTVVGTFRGAAQTETINLVLTGGQVALANTKFRAVAGAKPFDTITSVSIDATSLAGLIANGAGAIQLGVGPGAAIGFPMPPATGTDADVLTFSVNGSPRAIATNSDYTNQTFTVGTTADGDDISILYKVASGASAGTKYTNSYGMPEVPNGTDLSALNDVTVVAVGRFK